MDGEALALTLAQPDDDGAPDTVAVSVTLVEALSEVDVVADTVADAEDDGCPLAVTLCVAQSLALGDPDALAASGRRNDSRRLEPLRHSEHAHLLSDIEKLSLPILGSLFPFWIPTGDLVCQLEATST